MADKPATLLDEMLARYAEMPPDQQIELAKMALAGTADLESWVPQPGGQTKAYYSEADELFYGGSAGAGKTGLLIGLATTAHTNSLILRRENTQARAISDMIEESLGSTEGRTLTPVIQWRLRGR